MKPVKASSENKTMDSESENCERADWQTAGHSNYTCDNVFVAFQIAIVSLFGVCSLVVLSTHAYVLVFVV